jgi:hypothetical protein
VPTHAEIEQQLCTREAVRRRIRGAVERSGCLGRVREPPARHEFLERTEACAECGEEAVCVPARARIRSVLRERAVRAECAE